MIHGIREKLKISVFRPLLRSLVRTTETILEKHSTRNTLSSTTDHLPSADKTDPVFKEINVTI